jgi:hypothetical protein
MRYETKFQDNWKLKKNQLIALVNVIEKIVLSSDFPKDKISKINYWLKQKHDL